MLVAILSRLAAFSLRKPKTVALIAAGAVLLSFAAHYKIILAKNARLELEQEAYTAAVAAFQRREASLQEAITAERVAAASAAAERDEARRAIDAFRTGREADPESLEWAAVPIPPGELARLCITLPELNGCD